MYESVVKFPCGEVTVAKLPCGEVTGNRTSIWDIQHIRIDQFLWSLKLSSHYVENEPESCL